MKDYKIGTYCRFVSLEINIWRNVLESTNNVICKLNYKVVSTVASYVHYISKYFMTNNYYYYQLQHANHYQFKVHIFGIYSR